MTARRCLYRWSSVRGRKGTSPWKERLPSLPSLHAPVGTPHTAHITHRGRLSHCVSFTPHGPLTLRGQLTYPHTSYTGPIFHTVHASHTRPPHTHYTSHTMYMYLVYGYFALLHVYLAHGYTLHTVHTNLTGHSCVPHCSYSGSGTSMPSSQYEHSPPRMCLDVPCSTQKKETKGAYWLWHPSFSCSF